MNKKNNLNKTTKKHLKSINNRFENNLIQFYFWLDIYFYDYY